MPPIKRRNFRVITAAQFRAALLSDMRPTDRIKWMNWFDAKLILWGAHVDRAWRLDVKISRGSALVHAIRIATKMDHDQMDAIFDLARYIEFQDPVA